MRATRALRLAAPARGLGTARGRYAELRGPPHYPLVGGLPFFSRHGGPQGMFGVNRALYAYGNLVALSIFGDETLTVFDPAEFLKVHRAAGKTPTGGTNDLWMFGAYFETPAVRRRWGAMPMAFSKGEEWRRPRHALQHGMFSTDDAASYLPAINEVVDDAVARLPAWAGSGSELQAFTCRVTFELIAAVILGERVGVLERAAPDPRDDAFVHATLASQQAGAALLFSPLGTWAKALRTPAYASFSGAMDVVLERSAERIEAFVQRGGPARTGAAALGAAAAGVEPYLARVLRAGALSREEVVLNVGGLLQGGVDTTANTYGWLLAHLAANPAEQAALAAELAAVLGDGPFDSAALPNLPRLRANVRESHRLTPTVQGTVRQLDAPIELHDARRGGGRSFEVPAGVRISFSSVGCSLDPRLVDSPEEYRPDRWLGGREGRKGSPLELLDHNILSQPFSFGPRMCLGARIAQAELHALVARTVRAHAFALDPPGQAWGVRNDFLTKPEPFPRITFVPRK